MMTRKLAERICSVCGDRKMVNAWTLARSALPRLCKPCSVKRNRLYLQPRDMTARPR